MFRQLQQREELGASLEQLMRRRDQALMSRQDAPVIRDLEDQIESMKANIDYIQEGIAESQTNIMQIEDSKVCVEFFFHAYFFRLPPNRTLNLQGDSFKSGKNSKEMKIVLVICGASVTDSGCWLLRSVIILIVCEMSECFP